jgi:hypothetical protein
MSMYTELLVAALGQLSSDGVVTEQDAIDELVRCRAEREKAAPPTDGGDMVPVVLALEIAYDVALLRLARLVGVEADPGRFDQPRRERERLEKAVSERGIGLEPAASSNGNGEVHPIRS